MQSSGPSLSPSQLNCVVESCMGAMERQPVGWQWELSTDTRFAARRTGTVSCRKEAKGIQNNPDSRHVNEDFRRLPKRPCCSGKGAFAQDQDNRSGLGDPRRAHRVVREAAGWRDGKQNSARSRPRRELRQRDPDGVGGRRSERVRG